MNRRQLIAGAIAGGSIAAAAGYRATEVNMDAWKATNDRKAGDKAAPGGMKYRVFGRSNVRVSEVGFGAWGIGGAAYGAVARSDALDALARAEELGCNFVDTAMVYGDSEIILGDFLQGRRDKWLVATKYSGQTAGIDKTLQQQLARLRVSQWIM